LRAKGLPRAELKGGTIVGGKSYPRDRTGQGISSLHLFFVYSGALLSAESDAPQLCIVLVPH
jgi:hypothetical protein